MRGVIEDTSAFSYVVLYGWVMEYRPFVYQPSPAMLEVSRMEGRQEYEAHFKGDWPIPWPSHLRLRPRSERQAAVMGLGAFSGYHRRPQLKHTY
jgi:hypothetical protein